jgi:hypothetical protein
VIIGALVRPKGVHCGLHRAAVQRAMQRNDLKQNVDWLLASVPGSVTPNDVRVLVIKSDEGAPATELVNTP